MYAQYLFSPTLRQKPLVNMTIQVILEDLQFAPWANHNKAIVYVIYTINTRTGGPGGYFGIQFNTTAGGQFIFSMWDGGRWVGTGQSRTFKSATALVWPLNIKYCKRHCQHCGLKHLHQWKKEGITTGVRCVNRYSKMKKGDRFEMRLQRTNVNMTINTSSYGEGMSKAHANLGEYNKNITGAEWTVTVRDMKTNDHIEVGRILFEGDDGITRVGTYDETIGCGNCDYVYRRDKRIGPFLVDGIMTRKPIKVVGLVKGNNTICKKYNIIGSKKEASITFESGPRIKKSFRGDNKWRKVW